jgi:hypothetical protein
MFLLNCKNCDDVQRLVTKVRRCECGQSSGFLDAMGEQPHIEGDHARLVKIHWEQYDSAVEGEPKTWVLCYPNGDVPTPSQPSHRPTRRRGNRQRGA